MSSQRLLSREGRTGAIALGYEHRVWALVGGTTDACAYGSMNWRDVNGAWRATLDVAAEHFGEGELKLEMVFRPGPRASEPSVLLMHNGRTVRRVDVNQAHREAGGTPRRETHAQGEPPPNYLEWMGAHPVFSMIVQDSNPDGQALQRVFVAAAAELQVDVSGVDWIDPPEGRP